MNAARSEPCEQHQHDHADHEAHRRRQVGPGRAAQRRVAQLADHPAGADPARHQRHRDHDQHERQRLRDAALGQPVPHRQQLDGQRLQHPERQARARRDRERVEARDQRDAQRRDDEQRVGRRVDGRDGRDEDAGDARQDRRDDPVAAADAVGGEPDERRALLVLGARLCRQAEARVPVDQGQHRRDHDDDAGEPQAVRGHRDVADLDRLGREDRLRRLRGRAVVEDGDRLQREHHADRRADAAERARRAQRAVDQPVHDDPEHRRVDERERDRGRGAERAPERDLVRDHHPGELQRALFPQPQVHVGDEHRHRAMAEVDDPGAAVLEHQAQGEDAVNGTRAQAQEQEEDVGGQGLRRCRPVQRRPADPLVVDGGDLAALDLLHLLEGVADRCSPRAPACRCTRTGAP